MSSKRVNVSCRGEKKMIKIPSLSWSDLKELIHERFKIPTDTDITFTYRSTTSRFQPLTERCFDPNFHDVAELAVDFSHSVLVKARSMVVRVEGQELRVDQIPNKDSRIVVKYRHALGKDMVDFNANCRSFGGLACGLRESVTELGNKQLLGSVIGVIDTLIEATRLAESCIQQYAKMCSGILENMKELACNLNEKKQHAALHTLKSFEKMAETMKTVIERLEQNFGSTVESIKGANVDIAKEKTRIQKELVVTKNTISETKDDINKLQREINSDRDEVRRAEMKKSKKEETSTGLKVASITWSILGGVLALVALPVAPPVAAVALGAGGSVGVGTAIGAIVTDKQIEELKESISRAECRLQDAYDKKRRQEINLDKLYADIFKAKATEKSAHNLFGNMRCFQSAVVTFQSFWPEVASFGSTLKERLNDALKDVDEDTGQGPIFSEALKMQMVMIQGRAVCLKSICEESIGAIIKSKEDLKVERLMFN